MVASSTPDPKAHIVTVDQVPVEIGAAEVPRFVVFSKWDVSDATERLVETHPGSVGVSAHTEAGAGELVEALAV